MGALIRHFYNERHKGNPDPWWAWGVSVALGFVIVALSMAGPSGPDAKPARRADATSTRALQYVTFKQVDDIITSRCSMCHAKEPGWISLEGWYQRPLTLPPKHVRLDSADEILRHFREIKLQAVYSNAMPPGNITDMTAEERAILAAWIK